MTKKEANLKLSETQKAKVSQMFDGINRLNGELTIYLSAIMEDRGLEGYAFDPSKGEFVPVPEKEVTVEV